MLNNKLFSQSTAKKLMTGGVIGLVAGIILSFVILLPLYSKVGNCTGNNTCADGSFTGQEIGTKLTSGLMIVSLAAIVLGVLIMITATVAKKQSTTVAQTRSAQANPNRAKHLIIKTLALVAAFFVSTSIVIMIVTSAIPALFPNMDTNQQGHIFAYVIIPLYSLVGGFSVYATNRYLSKKLK